MQEKKTARADLVHAQTKRKESAYGPPRPPPKQQQGGASAAAFGPPRPPAKAAAAGEEAAAADPDLVGPPRPPSSSDDEGNQREASGSGRRRGGEGDDDDDDDDEEEEETDPYRLPISNEVVLTGPERAVTCVDVEHTGSRVAVGSVDNSVRLYDFNGMRSDLKQFRCVRARGCPGGIGCRGGGDRKPWLVRGWRVGGFDRWGPARSRQSILASRSVNWPSKPPAPTTTMRHRCTPNAQGVHPPRRPPRLLCQLEPDR